MCKISKICLCRFPKILARTGPRYPFSPYNYERLVDMCGDLWGSELTEQGPLPESSEGEKPSEEQLRRMDLDVGSCCLLLMTEG